MLNNKHFNKLNLLGKMLLREHFFSVEPLAIVEMFTKFIVKQGL